MIETGRFYRAGLMKDIDPGQPESTIPYYIKVEDNTPVPEGAVIEDGEFALAVVSAGFDQKTKKPTHSMRYYVKATPGIKLHLEKTCDSFAQSLARHLYQKVKEYQAKGLDYFDEMKKQMNREAGEKMNANH